MENKEGSASAAPPRQSGTAEGTSALSVDFHRCLSKGPSSLTRWKMELSGSRDAASDLRPRHCEVLGTCGVRWVQAH